MESLCPNCRTPMVEIGGLLGWKAVDDNWDELPETDGVWDSSTASDLGADKAWECPNCGQREYEP